MDWSSEVADQLSTPYNMFFASKDIAEEMINVNKRASEQNVQELVVAGKIIASILLGLMSGFLAYFVFNGIVIALVAAPIAGGSLIGLFFAPEEHRKTIASVLGLCVLLATVSAVMIRIESETYASFFGYLGGFAGVIAVLALIALVGSTAQSSNSNLNPEATEGNSGTTVFCAATLVVSLGLWFTSSTISKSLRPPQQQVAVAIVDPNVEKEERKAAEQKAAEQKAAEQRAAEQRAEKEQIERKAQTALTWKNEVENLSKNLRNQRQEEEQRKAYFSERAFEMSLALSLEESDSKFVRVAIYNNRGASFTVENLWHSLPYQIRLQSAQNLGVVWKKFAQSKEPDAEIFKIVDINGNEVGGSGLFGVWVQKE